MKKSKTIKEELSSSAKSSMKYMAFIDAASYISTGKGLLGMIAGDSTTIKKWFRQLSSSNEYKSKIPQFKSVSARFSTNPALKTMYLAIKKIKEKSADDKDKSNAEKNIQLVLGRIGKIISSKLTDEDRELFDSVSKYLDSISGNIGSSMDKSINPPAEPAAAPETPDKSSDDKSAEKKPEEKPGETPAEKPAATPAEKPAEKPAAAAAEKPAEKPAATPETPPAEKPKEEKPAEEPKEEPKKESVIREMMQRRVNKLVREMIKELLNKKK